MFVVSVGKALPRASSCWPAVVVLVIGWESTDGMQVIVGVFSNAGVNYL
jgi:hypothetical protein